MEQQEQNVNLAEIISPNQQEDNINEVNAIANVNPGTFTAINLFNEKELVAAENFLNKIMRSEKGGIKSVNDGLAILMRAQDLKLPFSSCIEHIHVINGKTGVDIHIIKSLLLRAGCTWRCIKDYQPLYEYTDSINVYVDGNFPSYVVRCNSQAEAMTKTKEDNDKGISDNVYVYPVKWFKDTAGNVYKDYQISSSKFSIAINHQHANEIIKNGKIPIFRIPNIAVDYVTEYEITRIMNGKEFKSIGKFTYNEAVNAGFFEKDTYKKYPRILVGHRAFTFAARDIGADLLFGVMELTELSIATQHQLPEENLV